MVTEYHVVRPRQIVEEIVITELQFRKIEAGEDLIEHSLVYQDGELIKKADASSPATMDAIGIMNKRVDLGIPGNVIIRGRVPTSGWTSGAFLFASTTPGAMSETPPSHSGNVSQQVARVLMPTLIEVNPQLGYMIAHE